MGLGTPASVRVGLRIYPHDEAWALEDKGNTHLAHHLRLQRRRRRWLLSAGLPLRGRRERVRHPCLLRRAVVRFMRGVSASSAKENEKGRGRGNASMCVESMGWGMIGTTMDDAVRRCRLRGWVLAQGRASVGEGMGGAWRTGGTIGGIFLPPPRVRVEVCLRASPHRPVGCVFMHNLRVLVVASGRLLDSPFLVFDFCIYVVIECSVDRGTVQRTWPRREL